METIPVSDDSIAADPSRASLQELSQACQTNLNDNVNVETQVKSTNMEQSNITTDSEAHFSEDSSAKPSSLLRKHSEVPPQIETEKSDVSAGRMYCSIQLATYTFITNSYIMVHVSILRLSIKIIALVLHVHRRI